MEKIDREFLIKEISTRLPYGVKAQVLGWDEEKGEVKVPLRIYSINTDGYVYFETNDYDINYLNVDDCLLYLRPMSSMTEEEKKGLFEAIDKDMHLLEATLDKKPLFRYGDNLYYGNPIHYELDFLISHHFDYRGLIPMGIALEALKDMYKIV